MKAIVSTCENRHQLNSQPYTYKNADASLLLLPSHNGPRPWRCVLVAGVQARPSIASQASSPPARALSLPGTPRLPMIRRLHPRLRHARPIHHAGNHGAPMVHQRLNPSDLKNTNHVTQTVAVLCQRQISVLKDRIKPRSSYTRTTAVSQAKEIVHTLCVRLKQGQANSLHNHQLLNINLKIVISIQINILCE